MSLSLVTKLLGDQWKILSRGKNALRRAKDFLSELALVDKRDNKTKKDRVVAHDNGTPALILIITTYVYRELNWGKSMSYDQVVYEIKEKETKKKHT